MQEIDQKKQIGAYHINVKPFCCGAFGQIHQGEHVLSKTKVAVKILSKSIIKKNHDQQLVLFEVKTLEQLSHPNIIRFFDVCETANNVYIVTEFICGGTLLDRVKKFQKLPENVMQPLFRQIAQVIHYMHCKNICHRDIKLENLMLTEKNTIKLIDFGFATVNQNLNDLCGSPEYSAPEMLNGVNKGYDGFKVDVWQLGIVLFCCLCGHFPFTGNQEKLKQSILNGTYQLNSCASNDVANLIQLMLEKNPHKRASMEDVLNHKWVSTPIYKPDNRINYKALYKIQQIQQIGFNLESIVQDVKNGKKTASTVLYRILDDFDEDQDEFKKYFNVK